MVATSASKGRHMPPKALVSVLLTWLGFRLEIVASYGQ
jgi:hypothetical protein